MVLAIAAPVILAVFAGTVLGRRYGHTAPVARLKILFVGLLVVAALFLLARVVGAVP